MTSVLRRQKKILSDGTITENVLVNMILDWVGRIGYENYKKEYEKWDECPCNRSDGVDNTKWVRV